MAVSKRTRFEVLRRDEFKCQYCGLRANETGEGLTVDHVVPVALGGGDTPSNLVAACRDCNSGKSSIQPDSPLVQGLSASAVAYALAMRQRVTEIREEIRIRKEVIDYFDSLWFDWTDTMSRTYPLPDDYTTSVERWWGMNIPWELFEYAIEKAMSNKSVNKYDKFRYMAGVIYRTLDERELDTSVTQATVHLHTSSEVRDLMAKEYAAGLKDGAHQERAETYMNDVLAQHIDRAAA